MNEQQSGTSERPATDRAEEMLNRLGQRFTDMRSNVGRAFEQRAQQRQQGDTPSSTRPASERAQETLGDWGERVGFVAGVAGLRLRQWGARAREEAEDLWAEAQSVRQQGTNGGATASASPAARADSSAANATDASDSAAESAHDQGPQPEQHDESSQPS